MTEENKWIVSSSHDIMGNYGKYLNDTIYFYEDENISLRVHINIEKLILNEIFVKRGANYILDKLSQQELNIVLNFIRNKEIQQSLSSVYIFSKNMIDVYYINDLPNIFYGDLNIHSGNIEKFPEEITVYGNVKLNNCNVSKISNIVSNGDIVLKNCSNLISINSLKASEKIIIKNCSSLNAIETHIISDNSNIYLEDIPNQIDFSRCFLNCNILSLKNIGLSVLSLDLSSTIKKLYIKSCINFVGFETGKVYPFSILVEECDSFESVTNWKNEKQIIFESHIDFENCKNLKHTMLNILISSATMPNSKNVFSTEEWKEWFFENYPEENPKFFLRVLKNTQEYLGNYFKTVSKILNEDGNK